MLLLTLRPGSGSPPLPISAVAVPAVAVGMVAVSVVVISVIAVRVVAGPEGGSAGGRRLPRPAGGYSHHSLRRSR